MATHAPMTATARGHRSVTSVVLPPDCGDDDDGTPVDLGADGSTDADVPTDMFVPLDAEVPEDLGLDGLPSTNELFPTFPYAITEVDQFRPFLDALAVDSPEQRRAAQDPAADDYYNFADNRFNDQLRYPGTNGASVQERYAHYYPAYELNSAVAQQRLLADGRGVSVQPNTEDINNNNTLDQAESFHRYEIPLDAAGIAASPFFLNTLSTTNSLNQTQTWYLLRIPVRTQNKTEIGGIAEDDFSRVEAVRLWTTGHDRPATLRIATPVPEFTTSSMSVTISLVVRRSMT